ncbi:MAG: Elongation factor P [Candidatus Woesebacteria bacterium GW2011_GWB1_38_5b]|uniref:Elongation factor P n=1 Tax=Candidatus Woesebacteria bacterium GW2011_GWB1_38_5b TaxID=1618569 RepID=A0A0G0NC81_9BACT|nr:MAG: Elongation factor P [Candidatus Woesebacteria bacterium GW2011_GWB1_38_5b]OGH47529.1 MAG: elongation factor P [Candidatus Levybacteria bacterium RIFCSPLOWO2_01_FULL_39_10]
MINVTDLRNGIIFEDNGNLLQVLTYTHTKMGRGSANIKVKVKNLKNGSVTSKSFINGAKVKDVVVHKKDAQYLYKDDTSAYFMDPVSFEQFSIPLASVEKDIIYLKEGESYNLSFLGTAPLALNLLPKMDFEVLETPPGVKGNSATNIYKDATLSNGQKVKVPLFIKAGDRVRVDTRTGEYSQKILPARLDSAKRAGRQEA